MRGKCERQGEAAARLIQVAGPCQRHSYKWVRSRLFATRAVATPLSVCDCSIQQATRRIGCTSCVDRETVANLRQRVKK